MPVILKTQHSLSKPSPWSSFSFRHEISKSAASKMPKQTLPYANFMRQEMPADVVEPTRYNPLAYEYNYPLTPGFYQNVNDFYGDLAKDAAKWPRYEVPMPAGGAFTSSYRPGGFGPGEGNVPLIIPKLKRSGEPLESDRKGPMKRSDSEMSLDEDPFSDSNAVAKEEDPFSDANAVKASATSLYVDDAATQKIPGGFPAFPSDIFKMFPGRRVPVTQHDVVETKIDTPEDPFSDAFAIQNPIVQVPEELPEDPFSDTNAVQNPIVQLPEERLDEGILKVNEMEMLLQKTEEEIRNLEKGIREKKSKKQRYAPYGKKPVKDMYPEIYDDSEAIFVKAIAAAQTAANMEVKQEPVKMEVAEDPFSDANAIPMEPVKMETTKKDEPTYRAPNKKTKKVRTKPYPDSFEEVKKAKKQKEAKTKLKEKLESEVKMKGKQKKFNVPQVSGVKRPGEPLESNRVGKMPVPKNVPKVAGVKRKGSLLESTRKGTEPKNIRNPLGLKLDTSDRVTKTRTGKPKGMRGRKNATKLSEPDLTNITAANVVSGKRKGKK